MIINIIGVIIVILTVLMLAIFKISDYLGDKPKTGKFRQWWSNNVVDLDNRYHE